MVFLSADFSVAFCTFEMRVLSFDPEDKRLCLSADVDDEVFELVAPSLAFANALFPEVGHFSSGPAESEVLRADLRVCCRRDLQF